MAMAAGRNRRHDQGPPLPDALVEITDLAGDGNHYAARVVSESFRGLPRVKQHKNCI
jgi:stress-induced morphogen